MAEFTCLNPSCSLQFHSKHSTAKYCSRQCAGIASMRKPEVAERQRMRMRKYTDEDLLVRLVALSRTLGRTPSSREVVPDEGTYRARFGSYNNAVIAAGLQPNIVLPAEYLVKGRPAVPLAVRYRVLKRDGFRCQFCGGTPQGGYVLHVDHYPVPYSQGGQAILENLITGCSLCNWGKGDSVE